MQKGRRFSSSAIAMSAILGTLGLGAGRLSAEHAGFSFDTLKGEYVLYERGTAGGRFGVVSLGRYVFDGNGGITGWQTVQSASSSVTTTCVGSYTVNPDGSGMLNLTHTMPGPVADGEEAVTANAAYRFLVFGKGAAGWDLKAIRDENGDAVTTTFSRSQSGTSMNDLKGTFILSEDGSVGQNTALAGLGLVTMDGAGGVAGQEITQIPGLRLATTFTGTYAIGSDGIGSILLTHTLPDIVPEGQDARTAVASYKFLVVKGADGVVELRAIRADNGTAVSSSFRAR